MPINHYRKIAMRDFGKQQQDESFTTKQMANWCNTYRTKQGRIHKQTSASIVKMHGLLKRSPEFESVGNNEWKYIGDGNNGKT
tara:strand:+ start:286 stop:534 length:249 start_codon:yes stop_codon:yes gene_type:complete